MYILALHLDYGGVEKAIISLANLLAERYEVEILSVYDMPGGPAYPLDARVKVRYLFDDVPNREAWKAAVRALRPGAVVRESLRSLRTLRGKREAVIRAIREIDEGVLITTRHEDNQRLSRYGADGVLKIAQLHHDHRFAKKYVDGFKKRYGRIDVFTLLTPSLTEEVRQIMADNRHTRVVCVPNFLERFPAEVSLDGRDKTVLTVGRLDAVKGFDRVIRCFARALEQEPGWTLRIIGEGGERAALEKLIAEMQLEKSVILTGRMDGQQVEREMLGAAFYAMGSHSEGFPFVLIEAQSCGLPTVAFDVRVGPGAILADGEDGFLVPDGDEEAYTARLLELMRSDELRARMGKRATERVQAFSRENVGKTWFSLIEEERDGTEEKL